MGKIFGISDLPVSTIDKVLSGAPIYRPMERKIIRKVSYQPDEFVKKTTKQAPKSFVAMRNGIGKLMSHFSKKKLAQ